MDENETALVQCHNCGDLIEAHETASGRITLSSAGGVSGGAGGLVAGATNGIAGSIGAMAATVPFGVGGLLIGGLAGYIIGDHVDGRQCPNCGEKLDI
ncbi:hypothetical protein [Halobellus ruber]|uniref:Glycine zipper domain-containing protein n=1 Tax=Halobellus ruber TaxID=2761102 RepID=A0A7J9SG50_9EURY|nr:hypothetical protein [Halobellus ruber]MBB6645920.1 hypothetical protein [Halobellus ruber]